LGDRDLCAVGTLTRGILQPHVIATGGVITVYRSDQTAFKNFKFDFEFSEFSATSQGEMFSLAAQRPREVQRNTEQSWIWSVK
jgi:hypothetical protein